MFKKAIKITFIAIIVVAAAFFSIRYYAYNAGKRDLASEEVAYDVTSGAIVSEFTSNTPASNKKYLEKAVAVTGTVTAVNGQEIVLDNSVNCNLTSNPITLKKNQKTTIKGRVIGFDDLFGELKLDQCTIQNIK